MITLPPRSGTASKKYAVVEFGQTTIHARLAANEMSFAKETEIFGENEPADHIYQVMRGAVRSYKMLTDGRRQIAAFCLPGDIFGLDIGANYRFTAEAIVDTTVHFARRPDLDHAGTDELRVFRDVLNMTAGFLKHAEDHIVLLGRKSALERVATFLLEMDNRLEAAGVLELPMCRRDIADYLGLTLETVSRALSQLQHRGIVAFAGPSQRQIVLSDRRRLQALDR